MLHASLDKQVTSFFKYVYSKVGIIASVRVNAMYIIKQTYYELSYMLDVWYSEFLNAPVSFSYTQLYKKQAVFNSMVKYGCYFYHRLKCMNKNVLLEPNVSESLYIVYEFYTSC